MQEEREGGREADQREMEGDKPEAVQVLQKEAQDFR